MLRSVRIIGHKKYICKNNKLYQFINNRFSLFFLGTGFE